MKLYTEVVLSAQLRPASGTEFLSYNFSSSTRFLRHHMMELLWESLQKLDACFEATTTARLLSPVFLQKTFWRILQVPDGLLADRLGSKIWILSAARSVLKKVRLLNPTKSVLRADKSLRPIHLREGNWTKKQHLTGSEVCLEKGTGWNCWTSMISRKYVPLWTR